MPPRRFAHTRSTSASVSISSYEEICAKVSVCFFALLVVFLGGAIVRAASLLMLGHKSARR